MLYKIITVIILAVTILFVACEKRLGQEEYIEIEKLPKSEQLGKFSSYPVEKQLEIYLFSQFYIGGGSDTFERYMASDGVNKLPAIVKRIDESSESMVKTVLIRVIELINMNCLCVSNNADVIQILEKNKMQINKEDSKGTRGVKEAYSDHLQRIKSKQ